MSAGVQRDSAEEFLRVIDNTVGRDRLARLFQFFAKYAKFIEEQRDVPRKEFIDMWVNIQQLSGNVRKVLRLFRAWQFLRQIQQQWPDDSARIDLPLLLNTAAKLSLVSYFLSDHLILAKNVAMWKPPQKLAEQIQYFSDASWLSEIIFTSLETLVRLSNLSSLPETAQTVTQRAAYVRTLIRYLLDLPIALSLLKLTGKTPDGVFGALGVASSLLGFYDTWPTIPIKTLPSAAQVKATVVAVAVKR
jgi:hypothetical protein